MKSLKLQLLAAIFMMAGLSSPAWAIPVVSFGQTASGVIGVSSQVDNYTFTAVAGDHVLLGAAATSGTLIPKIQLYYNGVAIVTTPPSCGSATSSIEMGWGPLAAGNYTVKVSDCGSSNTGGYNLYAQRTNNPSGAANLVFGSTPASLINLPAQFDTYSFSATAGDSIYLAMTATSGTLIPKIYLYNPDGSMNSMHQAGGEDCLGTASELNATALPTTGTYTVVLGDCSDTNTGNYSVYAQRVNNPTGATPVFWGQAQSTYLASAAASNAFTFVGHSGNSIGLTATEEGGTIRPVIRLYNPDGSLNVQIPANANSCAAATSVALTSVSLTQPGTYTVLVGDCALTGTGTYNLTSSCAGTCPVTPKITWTAPAAITYPAALSGTQLNAVASVPNETVTGTMVYSPASGSIPHGGSNTLTATFTPNNTDIYTVATASVPLTVYRVKPTLTWNPPAAIMYGTALSSTQLDATASVAGTTFVYTPGLGAQLPGGVQTLSVNFNAADSTDYAPVQTTVSITVDENGTLTSPSPGATLAGSSQTFEWSAGYGVTAYIFHLGTTSPGSSDIYNSNSTTAQSAVISNIPTSGVTLFARLYSEIGGVWRFADFTYTEAGSSAAPALISPTPGNTLTGSSATFTWSAGSGVSLYMLWLGTKGVGANDLFNSGQVKTTSAIVTGIPVQGVTIYARLFAELSGVWQTVDYTYTEVGASAPAALTSPTPSTTLTSATTQTFYWSPGSGCTDYMLWVGTKGVGTQDLLNSGINMATSAVVTGIPNGGATIYARLFSKLNGSWVDTDYIYTEYGTPAKSAITAPAVSSTLTNANQTFTWSTGTGVAANMLWLGTTGVGSNGFYNSGITTTHTTLPLSVPANGVTLYARLFSELSGVWQYTDYTYTEYGTPTKSVLTAPAVSSTLTNANQTFTWSTGTGVAANMLWLGTTGVGSNGFYNSGITTTHTTLPLSVPANGVTLYARLFSQLSGSWVYTDYTYTEYGTPAKADLTTPSPGNTLSGADVTFSWTNGVGVSSYMLILGSTGAGSSDLYNSAALVTSLTSAPVTGLPTLGMTIYARLYSKVSGTWQHTDYTYIEAGSSLRASLTTPAGGSTLSSASINFSWTTGTGVTAYQLLVGSTGVGSSDVYNSGSIATTSATSVPVPATGAKLYIRLSSKIGGIWQSTDYSCTQSGTIAPAVLSTPSPNSKLASGTVTFSWTAVNGVTTYQLWLGTTGAGSKNLFNSGSITTPSAQVTGLPSNGVIVYARLFSLINGVWQFNDYTYTEAGTATQAILITPLPATTLSSANVTFTWSQGTGVTAYMLTAGSAVGSNNYYTSGVTTSTFANATGLPTNGKTVHVRLYSQINGAWQSADYAYATGQ